MLAHQVSAVRAAPHGDGDQDRAPRDVRELNAGPPVSEGRQGGPSPGEATDATDAVLVGDRPALACRPDSQAATR